MICNKTWLVKPIEQLSLPSTTFIQTYRAAECLLLLAVNEFTQWVPDLPNELQLILSTCSETDTLVLSLNTDKNAINEEMEMISESFNRIMMMERVIAENAITNKTPASLRPSFFSIQMPWSFKDDSSDSLHTNGAPCVACRRNWTIMCQLYHQITSDNTSHASGSKSKRRPTAGRKASSKSHAKTATIRTRPAITKKSLADASPTTTRPSRSLVKRKVTFKDESDEESDLWGMLEEARPPSKRTTAATTRQAIQTHLAGTMDEGGVNEEVEEEDVIDEEESDEDNELALYDSSTEDEEEEDEEDDEEDFQPSIKYAEDDELVVAPQGANSAELEDDSEFDDDEEGEQDDEEEDDENSVYVASMDQQQEQDPEPEEENSWQ